MIDIAIKVENLSKLYHIGSKKSGSLRESLMGMFKGKEDLNSEFWALKDVSFDIKKGEAVGIIGKNGAGKSTLLKILSRITEPTKGCIDINGRVSSLLEVGTGFHPELTGRENIFLNGTILGMTRREVKKKFDEIVDFSGIEKFLDTPVKHYSSGMYVRLAFAVAAHLEPEILIIDEVLAVGDAEFQKKCLGKMDEVSRNEGRTVIFVSHNMDAVTKICSNVIFLEKGQISFEGKTDQAIKIYLQSYNNKKKFFTWVKESNQNNFENPFFSPHKLALINESLQIIEGPIKNSDKCGILIEGEVAKLDSSLTIGFALYSSDFQLIYWSLHTDKNINQWVKISTGYNKLIVWLPKNFLNEGNYSVHLILSLHFKEWISKPLQNAPFINLTIQGGLSESPYWNNARPGILAPILSFEKIL